MTSQSRRDLLKKSLAIGAGVYVAPKLVGQVTTVHAQQLSGIVCPQAEPDCQTFSCFQGECACVPTVGGATVCVVPSCVSACNSTADCPPGTVCFMLGCCGAVTYCVPLCFAPAGSSGAHLDPWKHR